jgi:hypothetical protein
MVFEGMLSEVAYHRREDDRRLKWQGSALQGDIVPRSSQSPLRQQLQEVEHQ